MDKKKIIIPYVIATAMILGILGYTFAYFSATVKEEGKTETVIKTKSLNLIYTGVKEITTGDNMIPGDSFTKTFTVENTGEVKATFDIYMENITNEFNEDLVYTISDENGVIKEETPLPVTGTKSYISEGIEIEAGATKTYTLKIEYKYLDTPQNDYQGSTFRATVGIDGNKIENQNAVAMKYYAFGLPDTTSPTNYNDVIATSGSNTFVQLEGEQLSVCIYRNNTLECFKNNNFEEETEHLKQVFGEDSCSVDGSSVLCNDDDFTCRAYSDGIIGCNADAVGHHCDVDSGGRVRCY